MKRLLLSCLFCLYVMVAVGQSHYLFWGFDLTNKVDYASIYKSADLKAWILLDKYTNSGLALVDVKGSKYLFYKGFGTVISRDTWDVTLTWNAPNDPSIVAYNIYWGTNSMSYQSFTNVGMTITATVPNLPANTTYYFSATSLDSIGMQSDYCNEVRCLLPMSVIGTNYPLKLVIK